MVRGAVVAVEAVRSVALLLLFAKRNDLVLLVVLMELPLVLRFR